MIDNSKEYILCAAYRFKKGMRTTYMDGCGVDANMYNEPHRQVFGLALGWRHPDIIYKYGDIIDQSDLGGFCTSKGRYVDRKEAAKIALECGQISEDKRLLYSEDIY